VTRNAHEFRGSLEVFFLFFLIERGKIHPHFLLLHAVALPLSATTITEQNIRDQIQATIDSVRETKFLSACDFCREGQNSGTKTIHHRAMSFRDFNFAMRDQAQPVLCLCLPPPFGDDENHVDGAILSLVDGDRLNQQRLHSYLRIDACNWLAQANCSVHHTCAGWQIKQCSETLTCAVNDVRLELEQSCALDMGDYIELGMLRLVVGSPTPTLHAIAEDATNTYGQSGTGDTDSSDFLWQMDGDPFHDLPHFDAKKNHTGGASQPSGAIDVVAQLAEQYVLALTDPAALQTQRSALGIRQNQERNNITIDQMAGCRPVHYSLEDTLSGQLHIDQILNRLGPLPADWDRCIPAEDVLTLLAADIPLRTQNRLPELTRREHHELSPDSHAIMVRAHIEISGTPPAPSLHHAQE
jgi:hypothetical protein